MASERETLSEMDREMRERGKRKGLQIRCQGAESQIRSRERPWLVRCPETQGGLTAVDLDGMLREFDNNVLHIIIYKDKTKSFFGN